MPESCYRRIVLKLSGESLASETAPLDPAKFNEIAQTIAELLDAGVSITVVPGGGNIFRGSQAATCGLDQDEADEIGMTATAINAQFLAGALHALGIRRQIFSRGTASGIGVPYDTGQMRALLDSGCVAIVAGGSGETGHSTDLPAVQAAIDTEADVTIMSKNGVDGVLEADPRVKLDALLLPELTASDALRKNLAVMDSAALILARDNGKLIHVIGADQPVNIRYAIEGKEIGSVVHPR